MEDLSRGVETIFGENSIKLRTRFHQVARWYLCFQLPRTSFRKLQGESINYAILSFIPSRELDTRSILVFSNCLLQAKSTVSQDFCSGSERTKLLTIISIFLFLFFWRKALSERECPIAKTLVKSSFVTVSKISPCIRVKE